MNYGKKSVRDKQRALNSKTVKWGRKIALTCMNLFLAALIAVGVLCAALGLGMFRGILSSTPQISLEALIPSGQATLIYDNQGNEIDKYVGRNSNRMMVTMDNVSPTLGKAFVAIEDERFYSHNGVDVKGMARAVYQFVKTRGRETQGASTITQQLLKNAIFTDWTNEGDNIIKKIKRKLQEQLLAIEVSKKFSKDQVLLAYMNTINLGQNTLGVETASLRYFGKNCVNLSISECAVIASITQNPSKYNPISHPSDNAKRREKCLKKMLELEFISQAEYDEAMADSEAVYQRIETHNTDYEASSNNRGTYFSDALQNQVLDDLIALGGYNESVASNMLMSGGLRIYSTLDPEIQAIVDEEFANPSNYPDNTKWYLTYALTITGADGSVNNYSKEQMMSYFTENGDSDFNLIFSSQEDAYAAIETYRGSLLKEGDTYEESISMTPQPQASITIMDQSTGYVVALLGGRGAKEGRLTLNRATDTTRQPGSTFKVVSTYAPALDSAGLTLATTFNDAPFSYADGRPVKNWYSGYRGITSIRKAIEQSMNIIAVKTLTKITPQLGFDYLLNFGFTTLVERETINNKIYSDIQQSLALGGVTKGVTNLELNAAYATIANGGAYLAPKLYTKVTDSEGNVILDNTTPTSRQVIKPTTAFLLTDAMADVVTQGTGSSVNFGTMPIAGKTGTTSDNKDVWFSGYTPYYTATTWAGYDNNVTLNSKLGETNIAKKLWRSVMSRIHNGLERKAFTVPGGIVQATVCSLSGKLPLPGVCDATLKTEYFAEGTVPTDNCNVHYQGPICLYDNLPASDNCPFKVDGVYTLPLPEDSVLQSGGDGTGATPRCQHDANFFARPDYQSILDQQKAEIDQRIAAATAAAAPPPAE